LVDVRGRGFTFERWQRKLAAAQYECQKNKADMVAFVRQYNKLSRE
jgi:hypothetical protein|tara:strand:- start:990 stop:1127 length:138 start_codon:yes stop_codon:yes gene_type:complete